MSRFGCAPAQTEPVQQVVTVEPLPPVRAVVLSGEVSTDEVMGLIKNTAVKFVSFDGPMRAS